MTEELVCFVLRIVLQEITHSLHRDAKGAGFIMQYS